VTEERVLDTSTSQEEPSKRGGKKLKVKPASDPPSPPPPAEPKKRGRPAREPTPPPRVQPEAEQLLNIDDLDLDDRTFQFRVSLRVGDLLESIARDGQQIPVFVRPSRKREGKYQLISGFRRVTALQKLGGKQVKALVRRDLDDNETAFRVSVLENEERKTYNDLDRASAILAYRGMGRSNAEIEDIFRIGSRQRQRLEALTTFPDVLKEAIAEENVDSTKAVRLMQHARQHVQKDFSLDPGWSADTVKWVKQWIAWIVKEGASLEALIKALKEELADEKHDQPIEFCVPQEKDGRKSLRIRPIAIDAALTPAQRKKLIEDLKTTIRFVESLAS